MPEILSDAVSVILEVNLRASLLGAIVDPNVEIRARSFRDVQFLDRGVRGCRYLNLSRLLKVAIPTGEEISLQGRHLGLNTSEARIFTCNERLQENDSVIVVAPHPDDAEIAAFGLYSTANATVVTVTAGDASNRYRSDDGLTMSLPRSLIARMRVWDSITVPQYGGVPPDKAVNLCYPDEKLCEMRAEPTRDFQAGLQGALDFASLRGLNLSMLVTPQSACSWKSLVQDLAHIFEQIKPTVIVVPHPQLDPSPDHLCTTLAVCEALKKTASREGRFYFYVNHSRHSELYPLGPAGSGSSLWPIFASDKVGPCGFYSHALSQDRQREKFLALEAMHDVRSMNAPQPLGMRGHLRKIRGEFGAALHGMGLPATSYLRRAVRPDEFFFVVSFTEGQSLCERAVRES